MISSIDVATSACSKYRADLCWRIDVVWIFPPPLREQRQDIPLPVAHFLDRSGKENRRVLKIAPDAM